MSSGLRPATRDGLPYIGFVPGCDNALVAAGHFRNGILLAPITGEIIASLAQRREAPVALKAVAVDRG
jgi:glycine/D-amino acid oxidase-like deaminating enzyme